MFFSVIITTFNRADILAECLEAYFNQSISKLDFEIIVVNDGSTDNTAKIVSDFKKHHKNLKYIYQKNQGQGVARNSGIKVAKGEVILIGQDDIIPTFDFLYEHQKFHYLYTAENDAVLGFTAWHPRLKVNNFMKWMVNGSSLFGLFGGHQFAYEKLRGKTTADYNFFYTSNISLKRSLLKKFHFDPMFSGYGWEDIELGYRLHKAVNLHIHYNSWAVAYHFHHMEESSLAKRMIDIGSSAWIFHKKHPDLNKVPGLAKIIILSIISLQPFIWFFGLIKVLSGNRVFRYYYYILSKKYFLVGLAKGKKKYT